MTREPRSPDAVAAPILSRLAGFFAFLRGHGVAVGIGAELDLGEALLHIPILDRHAFLDACRATLAKSPRDLQVLEEFFDPYWEYALSAEAREPSERGVVPRSPPLGRVGPLVDASRPPPIAIDRTGVVRIGVYSPDAPPGGHPMTPVDRKRLQAFGSGARRFRRFAATRPGRRFEPSHRGKIDFPSTARGSLRHGGEWLDVRRRRRKRQRADFAVLWDVSGSMREHDSELFGLVYAILRVSRRSRAFAFSTHLEEVTDRIRAGAYPRAMEAVARSLGPAGGGTRIGHCLQDFDRRYGAFVRRGTTLLILSDGWDLGETSLLGRELDRLRRRSHLVVWVNPYAREPTFEPATAAMREALPYTDLLLAPADFESTRPFRARGVPPKS